MNFLSKDLLVYRSRYFSAIRSFFKRHGFIEIDTPVLLQEPGQEPYLEPFQAFSEGSNETGFLITSPEYSLKQVLATGLPKVYEIAHCFRSGEVGSGIHTPEFLMLEFYESGKNELELIETCLLLFAYLDENFHTFGFSSAMVEKIRVPELFEQYLGMGDSREELLLCLTNRLPDSHTDWHVMCYEDLFFLVFLNFIEPFLPDGLLFLYDYPPELAALAKIVDGRAKRFEIYWNRIELANAFWELTDKEEQVTRFQQEQQIRKKQGKQIYPINNDFLQTLEMGIPDCAGIAIGLDRLLMAILGHVDLQKISPYFKKLL
ncbi:MAG: amino acid--tRNA ligase-related protein [Spirochaetota bacterium]